MLKSQPSKIFFDKVNVFDIDRIDASDAEIAFLQTQKALKEGWLMDVGKVEEI